MLSSLLAVGIFTSELSKSLKVGSGGKMLEHENMKIK